VQQLKQVVSAVKMTPLFEAVNIPFHTQFIGDDGAVHADEIMDQTAEAMLSELLRVEEALRPLRSQAASTR
jgi:hypothetical protein